VVLIFTKHDEALYAEESMRAGAQGSLTICEAPEKMALALEHVLRGDTYFSPEVKQRMLHVLTQKRRRSSEFPSDTLSPRELEVLRLMRPIARTPAVAPLRVAAPGDATALVKRCKLRHEAPRGGPPLPCSSATLAVTNCSVSTCPDTSRGARSSFTRLKSPSESVLKCTHVIELHCCPKIPGVVLDFSDVQF
jgi:hypothetical protein